MKKSLDILIYLQQYEVIIASILAIFMVSLLTIYLLLPNLNKAQEIFAQRKALEKKLKNLKEKDSILSSLNFQSYKDLFVKLNQVLPESKDFVSLFTTFDNLERQSGVTVLRTDFQLGVVSTGSANQLRVPETSAFMIPLSIDISGSPAEIKNYLTLISEFSGRYITFEDLTYNDKKTGSLQVAFNGKAYYYPLPTTLAAVDTALPAVDKKMEEILTKVDKLSVTQEAAIELDKGSVGKKNLFQ